MKNYFYLKKKNHLQSFPNKDMDAVFKISFSQHPKMIYILWVIAMSGKWIFYMLNICIMIR